MGISARKYQLNSKNNDETFKLQFKYSVVNGDLTLFIKDTGTYHVIFE